MSPRDAASLPTRSHKPPPEPAAPVATPQQLAFRIVIEAYRASSGRAMTHLSIDSVAKAAGIARAEQRAAAVAYAVEFGLVELVDKKSICLTEEGRRLLR